MTEDTNEVEIGFFDLLSSSILRVRVITEVLSPDEQFECYIQSSTKILIGLTASFESQYLPNKNLPVSS
jgi:hypothetical protein